MAAVPDLVPSVSFAQCVAVFGDGRVCISLNLVFIT